MFVKKILRSILLGCTLFFIAIGIITLYPASAQGAAPVGKAESSIADILCAPVKDSKGQDLYRCINKLYRVALVIGSIGAVLLIVVAGYLYISGGHEQISTAKSMIGTSVWGIVILVGSYGLLRGINPALVEFKTIVPGSIGDVTLPTPAEFAAQYCAKNPCEDGKPIAGSPGQESGTNIACPGKLVAISTFNGRLNYDPGIASQQICDTLAEKLIAVKGQTKGLNWRVTSAVRGAGFSDCHETGKPVTGTCVDIGRDRDIPNWGDVQWNEICKAVVVAGGMSIANEAAKDRIKAPDCPSYKPYHTTSGPNLHINLIGQTSGPPGSGGSPQGVAVPPGIRSYSGQEPYPLNWGSNPPLKKAFEDFNTSWRSQGGSTLQARQAYRPPEYTDHIRSVWEAYQISKGADSRAIQGQNCPARLQFVTKDQVSKYTEDQKNWLKAEAGTHGFTGGDTPPSCRSDHEKGIAVDITPPATSGTTYQKWIDVGVNADFCHYIPGDEPHFALRSELSGSPNCKSL